MCRVQLNDRSYGCQSHSWNIISILNAKYGRFKEGWMFDTLVELLGRAESVT